MRVMVFVKATEDSEAGPRHRNGGAKRRVLRWH